MDQPFLKIKNSKVSGKIVAQIKKAIIEGKYKPGDRLPSERELLEMFVVSRSSLREALRTLEEMNLVVIKRGAQGGAFVRRMGTRSLSTVLSEIVRMSDIRFEEVSEVRFLLEPEIARLAARNRTQEEIELLQEQNWGREKAIKEGKIPIVATIDFHRATAEAAKNKMLLLIIDAIASIFHEQFKTFALSMDDHKAILRYHNLLLEAIRDRDEDRAFTLMQEHIADVTKRLKA